MTKLSDKFWLWGQDPGVHHAVYDLPGENKMDPREGCEYLGIDKTFRVAMVSGPFPPFDDEAEKVKDLKSVVWSAVGAGGLTQHSNDQSEIDEVLKIAETYPNISGAVLDDFFSSVEFKDTKIARHSVESIRSMRDKLHNFSKRKLDLWLVWYTYQFDYPVQDYLDLCDVITMWTWKGSDLKNLEYNIKKGADRTPDKRHLAGCYLWNYGETKAFTLDEMKYQCDEYLKLIKQGYIEGLVFCSNNVCDIGLETAEWTKKWIADVGDEILVTK